MQARDYAAALGVVLIWGTNFIAMKYALHDMTPFQLGAGRYLFAVLPLILIVRPPRLPWRFVLAYGLLQGVGQFGCLFLGLKVGMSAALGSVLMQTQVFFTALFGFVLLRERAGKALLYGLALAACGIACFSLNYLAPGTHAAARDSTTPLGFVLVLASAAMWAASNIVVRRAQQSVADFEVMPFMLWCSLVPVIPFVLLSLAFDDPATRWRWVGAPWTTWAALAYLGWFATILAYALWTGLLKRHALNKVAPFSLAVPVVGISSGMLILGDVITGWQWAGTALVVASLATVIFGPRLTAKRLHTAAAPRAHSRKHNCVVGTQLILLTEKQAFRILIAAQMFFVGDWLHSFTSPCMDVRPVPNPRTGTPKADMQLDSQSLPHPRLLGQRAMALALLDAIICPEVEYRYFTYDPAFAIGQHVAAMKNGEGDHWYLHLSGAGAIVKGHVHDLPRGEARAMALHAQAAVPEDFAALLHEPAFMMDSVSFCYWRRAADDGWTKLAHPDARVQHRYDGSEDYLSILLAPASCYYEYAADYFECEPPLASIEHLYAHGPLSAAVVRSLNPQMSLADALEAAAAIGYPGLPRRARFNAGAMRAGAACSGAASA